MRKSHKTLLAIAGAILLVGVVAFVGLWYFLLRDTAPPAVSLEGAATAIAGTPAAATRSSDLTGTWTIQGNGSFAGYRVDENLVSFGSRTAVGRTSAVQGSLAYDGHSITSVHIDADLTALKSDQSLRDETLKMQAIQTCQFPTASFELAAPIQLDTSAASGAPVSKVVAGTLTLHGVTKPVSLNVKGQLQDGRLLVVGSTTISFADYNIQQPRSFFVVSLDDHGTMEFQLVFSKSNATPAPATPQATGTPAGCGGFPPPGGTPPPGGFPPGGPAGGPPPNGGPGGGFSINTPAPVPSPVN